MKKLLLVTLLLVGLFTLSGCGEKEDSGLIKVGYLTDTNGLGDQAFNDAVYSGLLKAEEEFDIELTVVEPDDSAQKESGLRTLARNGNELVIAGSSSLSDAVEIVAPEFPDVIFVLFDGNLPEIENVVSLQFREQEAAYLIGAFAAKMVEAGEKIGFIGGMDVPVIQRFEAGFVEGAIGAGFAEEDILVSFTGVFNDPALGKQTADAQYNLGASIIFVAAGACNLGAFESADINSEMILGAATGQFHLSDAIIASHIKSVDVLGYNIVKQYVETGELDTGITSNGLAEGGVDFRVNPNNDANGVTIPESVLEYVETVRQQIISGEIVVSTSLED